MSDQNSNDTIAFDLPKNQSSVIKVIGVGGGGSNAVNHMYGMGIRGVDFVVCNTDSQALSNSPVPNKIQLGVTLTEGLGAGANPEVGQQAALETIEEIKNLLQTNTKMVFITAGMGGGTGTGAAPVIAKAAKEAGILTVGICTIPFLFEGNNRKLQAEKGVEALRRNVDSLVVINNNKLREVYGNLGFKAGFAKADEVLATAARGIAEVITHHYTTNIDLRDAKTVLSDSGTAIMGSASASGESRASEAIMKALDSPLLNDNHIKGAKNVLLLIVSGKEEITIDEIGEINDHIQNEAGGSANIIMGIGEDEDLGEEIAVTIVATGFAADQQVQVIGREPAKVVHTLEDEQPVSARVYSKPLQQEEECSDDELINRELAKYQKKDNKPQPALFDFDEPQNKEEELKQEDEPEPQEETYFSLKDEVEEKTPPVQDIPREQPTSGPEQEEETPHYQEEENEPVFEIGNSADEEDTSERKVIFTLDDEDDEEKPQAQVSPKREEEEKPRPQMEQPRQEEPQQQEPAKSREPIRYTLEDYRNLENQLKNAKPENSSKSAETRTSNSHEDRELNFELKKVNEPVNDSKRSSGGSVSPTESTIEESMRLRMDQRRAQFKSFNYRFKNNPNSVDEVANEPAYKRQGVRIEEGKYSTENHISRFSIDDSDNGPDIKTNNSFLHDNVD